MFIRERMNCALFCRNYIIAFFIYIYKKKSYYKSPVSIYYTVNPYGFISRVFLGREKKIRVKIRDTRGVA